MARVLVIEDNTEERTMYASLLYYNGFDVIEASDAIKGLELAREEHPDVIVMDYMLPNMNGLVAAEILGATPETAEIPILCLTAYQVTAERARASGCRELLRKPMPIHELLVAVRRHLPGKGYLNPEAVVHT